MRLVLGGCVVVLLSVVNAGAATTELADAAMKRNGKAVRSLLQWKADVKYPANRWHHGAPLGGAPG